MNFLYPGFLFALLAVLIPVVIHLFNFRKFKEIYFSNVAFLKDVKEQHSSREKLKNILILLARMFAIIFLVLAFARPFIASRGQAEQHRDNSVSIYIDNSYSMAAVNKEGNLLDEAKRKAKEVVNAHGLNARFQLLTNEFGAKHQRLVSGSEFLQALEEVKVSSVHRDLQQVINRQQAIFTGFNSRSAYIISDFQKGFASDEPIKVDSATQISLIKLNANALPNVSVDSVWSLSPVHRSNASEKIIVRIRNLGRQDTRNIPIKLKINNQQKAISTVNIKANGSVNDTLSYNGLAVGWQKGTVSINDFPITFDDELNFSFKVSANQQILAINGQTSPYLKALFAADPYFNLTEVSENNINYSTLNNYSLIVVNGLTNPSNGMANELKNYLMNGGSIVIFPNTSADLANFSSFLLNLKLPAVVELVTTPTKVASITLEHPLFKDVFESLPKNLDLPQVNRYLTFKENSATIKETLLQLPTKRTYLAKYNFEGGKVFLAATGLDEKDGNLAKHPLFVPLLYKIAFESRQDLPIAHVISKDHSLAIPAITMGKNQSLRLLSKDFEAIPEISRKNGTTVLYLADQIKNPGFYELKKSDSTLAVFAFSSDRRESNMNYDTQVELEEKFKSNKEVHFIDAKTKNIASSIAEKNNGTELWKLCLILSLVFIAAEILLVRFLNPTKNTKLNESSN